jgi:hypothetical protein
LKFKQTNANQHGKTNKKENHSADAVIAPLALPAK